MKLVSSLVLIVALSAAPWLSPVRAQGQTMQEKAEPYIEFADQIVAALSTGQIGAFRASLSPTLIKSMSAEELNGFVDRQVAPFFSDYTAPSGRPTIAPIRHPAGLEGFAFFRSFTSRSGQEKPFALYVLEEDGRLVVGNLVVGRRFQDVQPQQ
jgi:hypothetical protein